MVTNKRVKMSKEEIKHLQLDSDLLNTSKMTVLFCHHINRHVRNLIIYSIICVPGYYYKFFLFPVIVHIHSHVLLFNLIGVLHYFCRASNTIIKWGHGGQFWPKTLRGMLCVTSRPMFCKRLLAFQLVQSLESGSLLGCIKQSPGPSAGDMCC